MSEQVTENEVSTNEEECVELIFLPRPCEVLNREGAARWFGDDYPPFNHMATHVMSTAKDEELRWVTFLLAKDIEHMALACAKVLWTQQEARVAQDESWLASVCVPDQIKSLELLWNSKDLFDGSSGEFEKAYDELGKELVRRLKARGEDH